MRYRQTSHNISFQRNLAEDHEALSSTHKKRHLAYRVTVVYKETSGIKQASLGKNESCVMLELDPVMTVFPLLLSFNFCVSTPLISGNLRDQDGDPDQE